MHLQYLILPILLTILPTLIQTLFSITYPVHDTGIILITGASSGIGLSSAIKLDGIGYTVYAGVRKNSDVDMLKGISSTLRPIIVDTSNYTQCAAAAATIETASEDLKLPFVGLVNNAGVSRRLPMELESIQSVENMLDVNVVGVYRITIPLMSLIRKHKGRIVTTGSVAGLVATAGSSTYSASKFAVEGITDALRLEMAPFGVSVSIVEPAYVQSAIAGKQVGTNSPILQSPASDAVKREYEDFILTQDAKRLKAESKASSTAVTDEAIVHALTSPMPLTRYIVANYFGLPAYVIGWTAWLLPDRVQDKLIQIISRN
jgi:short-subunit dehydrogenase